jgi:hypothetical protein
MAKYGLSSPGGRAGQGAGAGPRMRGMGRAGGASLMAEKRLAMQKELAAWRVTRDALFAKYGLTAPNQGAAPGRQASQRCARQPLRGAPGRTP